MMKVGDDPRLVFCRVCGAWNIPPFPGYQKDAVCSRECFDEFKWRETLVIMRRQHYVVRAAIAALEPTP